MKYLASLAVLLCLAAPPARAQSATHTLYGTITHQSCQYYPGLSPDWTCWVTVQEDGGQTLTVELLEDSQAIGQAGQMGPNLPRRASLYYVLRQAGIDFARGIVRSQVRVFYIVDSGPA